jgi:hypothetical protein
MSKPNPKPEFPVCGCAGRGTPSQGGYSLRFMIDVLDRMNGQPAVAEVKPEPEDDRYWARQAPDRADFP